MVAVPTSSMSKQTYTCNVAHPASGIKVHKKIDPNNPSNGDRPCPPAELLGGPSVFIFPPKPKDILLLSRSPEVTCVVVDLSPDESDVQFDWYVDGEVARGAKVTMQEELFNSTLRVVSGLPINHQDWLDSKEFKCRVNHNSLPAPIEKTISKSKGQTRAPEVYVMPPPQEQMGKSKVSLTCMIMGFYPEDIDVEWQTDGKPIPEDKYKTTTPQQDTDGSFFLYSKMNLPKEDWMTPGKSFSCTVMHETLHNHFTEKSILHRSPGK